MAAEHWSLDRLQGPVGGSREGFWKMSPPSESFLDELVTWREIGFNMCHLCPDDYDSYDSLPEWALASLEKHAADPRPRLYTLEQLESARTSDPIWNAAQNQLRTEGIIHNYLRMLWAKRVLEWTDHPRRAYEVLEHLNNKWALDGRDPNSYSGILWTFGRYDRAWGPERPIYGLIRYMSSDNTARKLSLQRYLRRYGVQPNLL
jgi:deoxyribodipyrimidine photo-lyase